jgi:hypothetical protein
MNCVSTLMRSMVFRNMPCTHLIGNRCVASYYELRVDADEIHGLSKHAMHASHRKQVRFGTCFNQEWRTRSQTSRGASSSCSTIPSVGRDAVARQRSGGHWKRFPRTGSFSSSLIGCLSTRPRDRCYSCAGEGQSALSLKKRSNGLSLTHVLST